MYQETCVVVDIGGTSVKWSIAHRNESGEIRLSKITRVAHERNTVDHLARSVTAIVGEICRDQGSAKVAISTHGSVALDGTVVLGPFFDGYANFSWRNLLSNAFSPSIDVYVLNDGHAAAWGTYAEEFNSLADPLALFIVGAGVGGGIVCNGRLLRGSRGYAGLFGHVKACGSHEDMCICSRAGCVETVASGRAMAKRVLGRSVEGTEVDSAISALRHGLIAGRRREQDIIINAGKALGCTIGDIANVLDPEIVVIAGGIIPATDEDDDTNRFFEAARIAALGTCVLPIAENLKIVRSKLENPTLVGAAAYAFMDH